MELEPRLREAVAEQDPGDEFTVRVMAAVDRLKVIDFRSRRRKRIFFAGVLLAVGAAAAALVVQLTATDGAPRGEVAQQPVVTLPSQPVEVAAIDPPAPAEVQLTLSPSAQAPTQSSITVPPMDGSGRIVLLVMPVADRSGAPGARQAAEAFRAQLVHDFRGMNDLVVLESTVDSSTEARADFRLTVSSLEWRRPTPGFVEVISTTGSVSSSGTPYASDSAVKNMPGLGTEYWPLEARIEDAKSAPSLRGKARDMTVRPFSDSNGVRQPETPCSMSGSLLSAGRNSIELMAKICGNRTPIDRTAIASGLAEVMRQRDAPVPVEQTPALPSANTAVALQPGSTRRPMPDGLRIYLALMSLADPVERAMLEGRSSDGIPTSPFLHQMALNNEELVKLDKYLRFTIRSDRDNQESLSEAVCSRKAGFQTLDEFGMAMNELSRKTELHQESLGRGAEAELGPELFQKIRGSRLIRPSREMNTYDFPEIFRTQQRDLQTELNRLCTRPG